MGEPTFRPVGANVERSTRARVPIELDGAEYNLDTFAYRDKVSLCEAIAFVNDMALPAEGDCLTLRIHSGCLTGDVFHSLRCDCHAQLQAALRHITATPNAALIYMPHHEGRGIGLFDKIRAYAMQDLGLDTVDANLQIGVPIDAREYDLAVHIISDLGFSKVRLLTNNPHKTEALSLHGVEVVAQVPLVVPPSCHNKRYLDTKRKRLRHQL